MNNVTKALKTLAPLLGPEPEPELLEQITTLLGSLEFPGFTAHQVVYWHCKLSQSEKALEILKNSPYSPTPWETPERLMEIDHDFESLYELTEELAQEL